MVIKEEISEAKFTELIKDIDMLKLAVDVKKEIVAAGCYFHMDCAEELIKDGSSSANIWGANIYPEEKKLDFSAVFNIRPLLNNRSMEIQDVAIKEKVAAIIRKLLPL